MLNFTDQLTKFRNKAQLSGRPASEEEVSGIAQGYAAEASNRLNAAKSLEQQDEVLRIQRQKEKDMKRFAAARMEADEKARTESLLMTGAAGLLGTNVGRQAIGATVGGVGDIIGGIYGGITGGGLEAVGQGFSDAASGIAEVASSATWLCSETKRHAEVDDKEWRWLKNFRRYTRENHHICFDYYMRIGKKLARTITEQKGSGVWKKIRDELARPVIAHTYFGKLEPAFIHYREYTLDLIDEFLPKLYRTALKVIEADKELYASNNFEMPSGEQLRSVVNG